MQGYCTGGTLATVYASLHPTRLKTLTLTAPVIDGKRDTAGVGNLAKHIDVDKLVDTIGNMPPEFMYFVFSVLKPFEQHLERYLNFFKTIHDKDDVEYFVRLDTGLRDTRP